MSSPFEKTWCPPETWYLKSIINALVSCSTIGAQLTKKIEPSRRQPSLAHVGTKITADGLPAPATNASIISVASAYPPNTYTQADIARLLGVENPVVLKLLSAPHIATRRLMLSAPPDQQTPMKCDSPLDLHTRFMKGVRSFGVEAVEAALKQANVSPAEVSVILTTTSSGLALPGVSAIIMQEMDTFNRRAQRIDLCGMGCNAGMSGLRTLSQVMTAFPAGATGVMLCCEVSSAIYKRDETTGTGIVNSLFGDAAVAIVVKTPSPVVTTTPTTIAQSSTPTATVVDFQTHTFTDYFEDMRYEVSGEDSLYNFKLSKRIPEAVGNSVSTPVGELLERNGLQIDDIAHWVVHSGGLAVMNGVTKNLGLPETALRHTRSVLKELGNVSSGSFLISLERLLKEHEESAGSDRVIADGDRVVMIAMGPGTTIEVGLGFFTVNTGTH